MKASRNETLRIHDPLYGTFELDAQIGSLVLTPEVRRLSQVRLSNTLSPSLATFGEIRRFSHTLGVLRLCEFNPLVGYTIEERWALAASVLLHDIGTPPFGHLFEYHLKERFGWSHEHIIADVLWGCHAPENSAHQIHGGRPLAFRKALETSRISVEVVEKIVRNRHPLSALLFGSIDLDNLDNVARAAWSLGLMPVDTFSAQLASLLDVDREAGLMLSLSKGKSLVQEWARMRKKVYELLIFDPITVASQAVLFEAIHVGLEDGILGQMDWTMWDEQLLERLREHPQTRHAISFEYLGVVPQLVFCVQIDGTLSELGLSGRTACNQLIERILRDEFRSRRVLGHTVIDNGSFSKELRFKDPDTGKFWSNGVQSQSVILFGFLRSRNSISGVLRSHRSVSKAHCSRAAHALLEEMNVSEELIKRILIGSTAEGLHVTKRLGLAPKAN